MCTYTHQLDAAPSPVLVTTAGKRQYKMCTITVWTGWIQPSESIHQVDREKEKEREGGREGGRNRVK